MRTKTKVVYGCGGCGETTITVELITDNKELQDKMETESPTCLCGTNVPMYKDSWSLETIV